MRTTSPVSYTHLDVYKRQAGGSQWVHRPRHPGNDFANSQLAKLSLPIVCKFTGKRFAPSCLAAMMGSNFGGDDHEGHPAVSYTHLDVYKRQI